MSATRRAVWTVYAQDESGSRLLGQMFGDDAIAVFQRARALWPHGCLAITRDLGRVPTAEQRRILTAPFVDVRENRARICRQVGAQIASAREYTRQLAQRTADAFGIEQGEPC